MLTRKTLTMEATKNQTEHAPTCIILSLSVLSGVTWDFHGDEDSSRSLLGCDTEL
jgi:hypothetical protein